MLELGTRVIIIDSGATGIITARRGERCHYEPNCKDLLLTQDYEVRLDGVEENLNSDGFYKNYRIENNVEKID